MARCEFVVGIVMDDHEAPGRRSAADQQIDDRQCTHRTYGRKPVLGRIDPTPNGFRHGNIGVDVAKSLIHLIDLVDIARRSTELGSLGFA